MSERPWMPFYTGDFVKQTMHLGPTERGIYISLLIHAWNHDGQIPLDDARLCNITGCERRLWWQYKQTVLQFFDGIDASTAQHERVVTELRRSDEISNKRKVAAEQMLSKRRANAEQMLTQSQSQSHKYKERGSSEVVRVKDDPIPAGMLFKAADSDEYAAWSKVKRWPQKDFRINGRIQRGWIFPTDWPTSELASTLNGHSAPPLQPVGTEDWVTAHNPCGE